MIPFRPVLRALRHLPDRLLHPRRRARLLRRLRSGQPPAGVLFVCHGNIYRSPYAAAVFAASLPEPLRDAVRVRSAGFVGPNRGSPADAVAEAARQGIDLTPHRSALLDPTVVQQSTLVVVMDAGQKQAITARFGVPAHRVVVLGDLDPEGIETRAIRDPWGQTPEVLVASYARVARCSRSLAAALAGD